MQGTSSNNLEQSNEQESADERMLRELENRDGIYSFIFHELEARRSDALPADILEPSASATTNTVITTSTYLSTSKSVNSLPLITSILSTTATPTMTINEIFPATSSTTNATTSATRRNRLNEFRLLTSDDDFKYAFVDHNYPRRSTETTATCTSLNSYQSIFSDTRGFYSYMPNSSLSLRHTPPRFSHISAPMMRNRRHLLKNTAEYKKMYTDSDSAVPDLRALFPNDPDVYAPFENTTSAP